MDDKAEVVGPDIGMEDTKPAPPPPLALLLLVPGVGLVPLVAGPMPMPTPTPAPMPGRSGGGWISPSGSPAFLFLSSDDEEDVDNKGVEVDGTDEGTVWGVSPRNSF